MCDEGTLALQNYMDLEKGVPCLYGETYLPTHDANQAMNIKVEEISDVELEEGLVPVTFPEIKAEPEVSFCLCMPTVRQLSQII
jgi:hypothetical protein